MNEKLITTLPEEVLENLYKTLKNNISGVHIYGIHIHSMFKGYFGLLKNGLFVNIDPFWDTSYSFLDSGSINIIKPNWGYDYNIPAGHLGIRSRPASSPNSKHLPQKSFFFVSNFDDLKNEFDKVHLVEYHRLIPYPQMNYASLIINKLEFQNDGSVNNQNILHKKIYENQYDKYIDIP